VRSIQNFWFIGGEVTGPIPSRKLDVAAIGLAQSIAGHDYSKVYEHVSPETMMEMYYKIMINKYFFVTPDLQILFNPDMDGKQKTAVAIGVGALLLF
jgi:carbohydrate-selective porin OprB